MGPQDEAGLRRWVETALANAEAGTERPFATVDRAIGRAIGSSRFMSIVPEHKRLEIGWTWVGTRVPADRRQPRGEAPPADPRLRDARGEPGRVQDPFAQRALAQRAGRHRRDVRRRLPQPLDHARRVDPRLGLFQRDRRGMAGGQGRPRRGPGPMSEPADLLIIGGRVFVAYTAARPHVPYGSDIGPRPVGARQRHRRARRPDRLDRPRRRGPARLARTDDRGRRRARRAHHRRLRRRPHPPRRRRQRARSGRPVRARVGRGDPGRDRPHAAARPDAPWVLGKGWLYAPFPGGLPTRALLDAVVPDRPAFMGCYDGHTGWANSAALRAAGIDRETPDPADGVDRPRPGDRRADRRAQGGRPGPRHAAHPAPDDRRDARRDAPDDRGDACGRHHRDPGGLGRARRVCRSGGRSSTKAT